MASISFSGNGNNGNGSISGVSLAHRKLSPRERIQLAADVVSGACQYTPTQADIASSFGVHPSQLCRELKEREERKVAKRDRDSWAVDHIVMGWNSASDSALDRAVREIGLARVYDVVDRLTR
jgi:hypothetical protein